MSVTIHARGVAARQGDRELFAGLDLIVAPGEVVGLVGPNGAGKSTLLRILAGRRPPDAGSVRVTPATAHLGYLAQQAERVAGETVRDYLARRTGVTAAEAEFNDQSMALPRTGRPSSRSPLASLRGRWGVEVPELGAQPVADAVQTGLGRRFGDVKHRRSIGQGKVLEHDQGE